MKWLLMTNALAYKTVESCRVSFQYRSHIHNTAFIRSLQMDWISFSVTLRKAGKACQGLTLYLICPICKSRRKWRVVHTAPGFFRGPILQALFLVYHKLECLSLKSTYTLLRVRSLVEHLIVPISVGSLLTLPTNVRLGCMYSPATKAYPQMLD